MFVTSQPAMKLGDCLIIADLHIGITRDIWEKGVSLPHQSKKLAQRINELKKQTKTKQLIILGDVKHRLFAKEHDKREIEEFFSLLKYRKIIITKGNHDGNIEKIIRDKRVKIRKQFVMDGYVFSHGHRRIKAKNKIIVIGHNQPHIKLVDKMGAVYIEPVWLRGKIKDGSKLIIVPAFNELCGATVVNKDELLGPIAKKLIKKKSHVYLLDGTDLGLLSDLMLEE